MIASRVTPPTEEEEGRRKMEQKKPEESPSQSVAVLVEARPRSDLMIVVLMAHITEK